MRTISASKVAAILGLSPWDSPLSMWLKMHGDIPGDDGTNAQAKARGHYLESGVIAWWRDQHPDASPLTEQAHLTLEDWGAATPDAIGDDDGMGNAFVLDAKTAANDDHWGTPGTDEVPGYYAAQGMWQLACAPYAQVAYFAVLFGSPRLAFAEYVIPRDDDLIASIVARCREFYDSLHAGERPELDDHPATYEAIRKLHPDIERDAAVELTADEAAEYVAATTGYKDAERRCKAAQAVVLDRMGRARLANHDGQTIARRQPHKYGVSLIAVAKSITTRSAA